MDPNGTAVQARVFHAADVIRLLAANGADLHYPITINGIAGDWSYLHLSIAMSKINVASLLLELGANPNILADPINNSATRFLCACNQALLQGDLTLARLLIKNGASLPSHFGDMTLENYVLSRAGNLRSDAALKLINFIRAVGTAGGAWRGYLSAPRRDLNVLRVLCAKGRATPARRGVLELLFPQDATTRTTRAKRRAHPVLPRETWWLLVSVLAERSGRRVTAGEFLN